MAEGRSGILEYLPAPVRDRIPSRLKETGPKVPEWDGFIDVEKTKTHVVVHGNGFEIVKDNQGKESIRIREGIIPVIVNVGGADCYRNQPFDKALQEEGYTVVGWDPPGQTGKSDYLRNDNGQMIEHSMDEYAKFQDRLFSTLMDGKGKVIIVAMSMGGIPAEIFAGNHPDRVHKLILAATFATLKDREFSRVVNRQIEIPSLGAGLKLKLTIQAGVDSLDLPLEERAEAARRFFNYAWMLGRARTILQSFASVLTTDASEYCKKIQAKTLLLSGRNDRLAPLEGMQILQELIPNSELVVVNSGHTGVLGDKNHFNPESMAAIVQFLKD